MFRTKATDNGGANGAEVIGGKAPPQGSPADPPAARSEPTPVSCIGAGMSIVGTVECSGSAQVYGRIEGELRASDLVIGEGAQVEGSVIAQEVTVSGRVKGTIRAVRVTLRGGTVEGDIFNRSLSIDETSVFEGASRREENGPGRAQITTECSPSGVVKVPQKKTVQSPSLTPATLPCMDPVVQEQ
jgi:cytoskeletal protein CcmA (bactofilin family)